MAKGLFTSAVIALACLAAPSAAFAPATTSFRHADVQMSGSNQNDFDAGKAAGSTVVAAALFVSNVLGGADIAMAAMDNNNHADFAGSSTLVSARSGGRAGGRSSAARPAPSRSTTTIQRTTYVQPPVMVAPPPVVISPFGGYGYGYNPLGGVGTYKRLIFYTTLALFNFLTICFRIISRSWSFSCECSR